MDRSVARKARRLAASSGLDLASTGTVSSGGCTNNADKGCMFRSGSGPSGAPDRRSSPMDALTLKALYESQLREELKRPPTPDFNRREMSCMLRVSRGAVRARQCRHVGLVGPPPGSHQDHRSLPPTLRDG